jgi:hypothetical protein
MLAGSVVRAAGPAGSMRVTYVSVSSVYVSAGADDGVAVGDRLEVVRDGAIVAALEVTLTSSHKADCKRVGEAGEVRAGDAVRAVGGTGAAPAVEPMVAAQAGPGAPQVPPAQAVPGTTEVTPAPAAPAQPAAPPRPSALRGRIGVRYMGIRERDGGPDYQQPAIDLRLEGKRVGGSDFDVGADLRARRSYRSFADGESQTENRTRAYRLAAAWQQAGSPFRLTFGRQFSPSLAMVSLFDGLLGEIRKERWAGGAFVGTQPDPVDYGYSSDLREYGGFLEYGSPVAAVRRWAVTGGAVASYQDGEINREFLFLQGRYDDRRFSAYATQEVDLNRGWRKTQERDSWTATSGYASLRWRASDRFALNGGFDSRRSIRLYRDLGSPVTEVDDRDRRGCWSGADGRVFVWRAHDSRVRRAETDAADRADATTLTLGLRRLTAIGLDLATRSTRYTNAELEGWLHSLSVSANLSPRSRLEAYGGTRDETVLGSLVPEESHTWYGLNWDLFAGRHWMFTATLERNQGQGEGNDQVYATMGYRF